jgi:guanylate kinase
MRVERIIAYTDLRGKEVADKRSVGPENPVLKDEHVEQLQNQPVNPTEEAKLQREASLTVKPNIQIQTTQETDAERAKRLGKVHPDDLPCGHLDPLSIATHDLKTKGNIVVIITAPFGGGKDSVANVLHKDGSLNTTKAILYTSRPMGNKDVNGVDYYFVSREEFIKMRDNNGFLSWNDLESGFYGVHLQKTKELLNSGENVVVAIGPTVAKPLKKGLTIANIPFVEIFLLPTSKDSLEKPDGLEKAIETLRVRLRERGRGKTDETYIDLLLERSRFWLSELHKFEHQVENPNGKLDNAVSQVKNIIQAKKIEVLSNLDDTELAKLSPQLHFIETSETPNISLNTEKFKANKNVAVILTGPSGAGKGTLLDHLNTTGLLNITEALSNTTRPKGKNEVEGKDYFFVTRDEFVEMIAKNNLAEWVMVHNGYFWGKSTDKLQEYLDDGKDILFALNVSGAIYYRNLFNKLGIPYVDVFLSPVPKELLSSQEGINQAVEILRKRIKERSRGETEKQIEERMKIAKEWLEEANYYSHIVENTEGKLEEAAKNFTGIIEKTREESYRALGLPSELLYNISKEVTNASSK